MTNSADFDRLARELFKPNRLHNACMSWITIADQLQGRCPNCGGLILAGPIDPARAQEMLAELTARHAELSAL